MMNLLHKWKEVKKKMMNKLDIDLDALKEQVKIIKEKKERLNEIYLNLKKNNEALKDNWNSKTSEVVFNNFEEFYNGFSNQLNDLQNDINYLNIIIDKYKTFEAKSNKTIDEKIAT